MDAENLSMRILAGLWINLKKAPDLSYFCSLKSKKIK